jgi:hypothetical protein
VPIIRGNNCVCATLGTCYSMWMTVWYACRKVMHTRKSSTQNNKYQMSHKHSCFSWWWAYSCPKHVEIDKYYKKNCAPSWFYLQDYKSSSHCLRTVFVKECWWNILETTVWLPLLNLPIAGTDFVVSISSKFLRRGSVLSLSHLWAWNFIRGKPQGSV